MHSEKIHLQKFAAFLLFLALISLGKASSAQSQEPNKQTDFFEMSLEELTEVPITTGASRPMVKKKMPATVTVITAEELKLLGLRHLTDVINYIVPGGVGDIHRSTRTGLYAFRGITVDNNGKYVFMVDGHNATELTKWGAFNERYLGLLDELDRIEITQGVGSTLYGSGAISGVINFITKTGKDFQGGEIYTGYGSWEKYETTVKYGQKRAEDNHDFFYFGWKRSHGSVPREGGGSRLTKYGDRNHGSSGREWDHFAPSFKFHSNIQRGDFTLRMRYVQEKFEEPYFSKPACDYWDTADTYWVQNYLFIQPEITHRFSESSRIKANLAFGMQEVGNEKLRDWYTSGGTLIAKEGKRSITYGEKSLRGKLFHYYDGLENHKLTSGLELFWMHSGPDFKGRNRKINNSGVESQDIKRANLYFAAVFFEDIWQLDEKSTLFAGLRVENHNKTPVSITPRLAVSHELTDKTDLKLLYNSGYRTPNWAYYANNKSTGYATPDPEKVQSYEAHILHKFTPKFSTSLVGYYTVYKDLINYWWKTSSDQGYHNFPEVKASGLELTGDYQGQDIKLKFSHSFSRPVHFSNNNFTITNLSYNRRDWAQFPTHMTKAQAIINLVRDKCILGITYLRPWGIRGQRNADSKLKWPSNYLNATLTLKVKENMELQVSGYNLTGQDNPWWGARTYDGMSRSINPHTEYFVRLIWRF